MTEGLSGRDCLQPSPLVRFFTCTCSFNNTKEAALCGGHRFYTHVKAHRPPTPTPSQGPKQTLSDTGTEISTESPHTQTRAHMHTHKVRHETHRDTHTYRKGCQGPQGLTDRDTDVLTGARGPTHARRPLQHTPPDTHAHSCTHTPGPPTGESNQTSEPHSDPGNESAALAPLPRVPQKPAGPPSSPLLPLLPSPLLLPSLPPSLPLSLMQQRCQKTRDLAGSQFLLRLPVSRS